MRAYIAKRARRFRQWLLSEARTEVRGYQQLEWLLRDLQAPLAMTNMSVQPSTMLWIINDIRINRRKCIVELGAGTSTQLTAACLHRMGDTHSPRPQFFSVEENPEWIAYLKETLLADGLDRYVHFIHAPRPGGPTSTGWYDTLTLDAELRGANPDLLLVDGPSGLLTHQSRDRYGALSYFGNLMRDDCAVFIDDAERPAERELLEAWSRKFNVPFETLNAYLGVITRGNHYVSRPF